MKGARHENRDVLTSHDQLGNTGRKTGFWLEEFAAPLQADRIQSPDAQAMVARIEVRPDARLTARFPRELAARITVRTKDGRTLVKEHLGYEGGIEQPMSWDRVVEKFHWLSERFADEALRNLIIQAVQQIDARPISDLMNLLAQVRPSAVFPKTRRGI